MTEDPWYLAARVGTVIPLAFVRVDRVGSTGDWKELPPEEVARTRAAYVEAVEAAARSVKAAEPFHWQGDGLMFFVTDDRGRPATVRAFDASCRLWERLRVDVRIEARIGVHAARVAWTSDTGKLAHPAIDLCGHLEHVAPPGAVAVSEDVFLALPQKDRLLMARLGTTKRDRAPAYVFPAPAMDRKDPANFTISDDLDLWDAFRAYALGTDVRLLRYVGLPLQRIAPPSLEVEGVFVPAELDVPSRRVIGPPAREHEIREEETTSRSPVLDVLRDTRALVVLGDPGSGKTTLVKWLAVIAARGRLTWEGRIGTYERLLPLPVSVGKLAEIRRPKDCVVDAMACYFRSRNVGRDENALGRFLSERLEADECLVLLDGLDEVRAAERDEVRAWLETFASRYERNRFLVASRRVGYTSFALRGGTEVFLRPFDDAQVSAYVTAFARAYRRWEMPGLIDEPAEKQAAETLLAAIREHPRIQDMARNPFLLSGLALVHRAEGRLPRHRVHVYEIFARALCETWGWARRMVPSSGKPDIAYEEEAIPVLGELAIEMHENHPTGVAPEEFVVETLAAALGRRKRVGGEEALQAARKFLERAGRDVQLLMERGAGEWGFLHLTFQEFFAAAGLHAQERFDAFALEHLFDPRWEEVIRLGVGYQVIVQGRPAAAQRLVVAALARRDAARPWVTEILRKQVPMAALLAAEAGDALPEEVRERIAGEFARWATDPSLPEQGRFLHEVGQTDFREPVARALIPLLDDRHGAVREAAARALGEMKWESALPALLGTLKDRDVAVRWAAAWALGKMQSESALPALLGALKGSNSTVRRGVARALGKMKSESASRALLDALKDEDSDVRRGAAWALGRMQSESALPALLGALKDEDSDVRRDVAGVLGRMQSESALPALLGALKDENSAVRWAAAGALGRMQSESALPALLDALKDRDVPVRRGVAWALGEMKSESALPALLGALKDRDVPVRRAAAGALGEMKSESALPALLDALKDEESGVREAAARALGEITSESALPSLLGALKDSNVGVRRAAAGALGEMKSESALPALLDALKDENSAVRASAARALGGMKSESALPVLLDALKDENPTVRAAAAGALGEMKSESALPALLDALKDENSSVRQVAAKVLGEMKSESALPALLDALKDEDPMVRRQAAGALWRLAET